MGYEGYNTSVKINDRNALRRITHESKKKLKGKLTS